MTQQLVCFFITVFLLVDCTSASENASPSKPDKELYQEMEVIQDTTSTSLLVEKAKNDTALPDNKSETIKENQQKETSQPIVGEVLNKTTVEKQGKVIEFHQTFSQKNTDSEYLSEQLVLDLSNTSKGMLSAYSFSVDYYELYFRVEMNDKWSAWESLSENPEVNNPKRKAFLPKQLDASVSKIQFKSDKKTDEEVVFRIFTFSKI